MKTDVVLPSPKRHVTTSFGNVLIQKEGKPNARPSTRPLKSLFAPRATRVVRALLVDPQHAWRLEELAKTADVSLGHAHNVVKRLEELSWVDRSEHQRIQLTRPGELLDGWVDSYSYRLNRMGTYFSPERITRRLVGDIARAAHAESRRYAFTLHSGAWAGGRSTAGNYDRRGKGRWLTVVSCSKKLHDC